MLNLYSRRLFVMRSCIPCVGRDRAWLLARPRSAAAVFARLAADRRNLNVGPSCNFIAMAMRFKFMMVAAAQLHGKFLADLVLLPARP
jgi:hypothetical protein